jgi:hypothetical protein
LYIVLAVVFGLLPWMFVRIKSWQLIVALAAAVLLDAAGLAAGLRLYPWTNLPVAAIATTGGILMGRAVPPRFRAMMLLLLALAILDTVQVVATAPATTAQGQPPAGDYYLMFVVATSLANSAIGIGDLLVVAAMAEHWRRRGAGPVVAVAPGVAGLLITYPTILVLTRSLPLIPFLFVGFLLTQAAVALRSRTRRISDEQAATPNPPL